MRLALLASALAIVCAAPAAAQIAEGPSRTFQGRDIFSLRTAGDPQIRPDGGAIAYVRTTQEIMIDNGRPSIWLVDPATGSQTPLAADEGANLAPRWSPDGTRLAYISAGPSGAQLYVRWMATGRSAKVATLANSPNSIAWSPDGRTLAFIMLVEDQGQRLGQPLAKPEGAKWADPLQVIDRVTYRADGARPTRKPGYPPASSWVPGRWRIAACQRSPSASYNDGRPARLRSPDGKLDCYFVHQPPAKKDWERDPQVESDIYSKSRSTRRGARPSWTTRNGPDDQRRPISPDGKQIAYLGFDDHVPTAATRTPAALGDGPRRQRYSHVLTGSLDRSVGAPGLWAGGQPERSTSSYTEKGISKVARIGLDGKIETVATGLVPTDLDRPYTGGDFSRRASRRPDRLHHGYERPASPSDVGRGARGGRSRRS